MPEELLHTRLQALRYAQTTAIQQGRRDLAANSETGEEGLNLGGTRIAFYAGIYTHDVLVSIALAYPFAMLFAHLYKPTVGWRFIFIAALTIFIFGYWSVLSSGGAVAFFVDLAPQSIIGVVMLVGSLPIAYFSIRTRSQS